MQSARHTPPSSFLKHNEKEHSPKWFLIVVSAPLDIKYAPNNHSHMQQPKKKEWFLVVYDSTDGLRWDRWISFAFAVPWGIHHTSLLLITFHHLKSHGAIVWHNIASHRITYSAQHHIASHCIASYHVVSSRITPHHITSHHIPRHCITIPHWTAQHAISHARHTIITYRGCLLRNQIISTNNRPIALTKQEYTIESARRKSSHSENKINDF